MQDEFD
jgi:hypothetical protein